MYHNYSSPNLQTSSSGYSYGTSGTFGNNFLGTDNINSLIDIMKAKELLERNDYEVSKKDFTYSKCSECGAIGMHYCSGKPLKFVNIYKYIDDTKTTGIDDTYQPPYNKTLSERIYKSGDTSQIDSPRFNLPKPSEEVKKCFRMIEKNVMN
jgi:hypothetical protein